jgi:hypothetical protein
MLPLTVYTEVSRPARLKGKRVCSALAKSGSCIYPPLLLPASCWPFVDICPAPGPQALKAWNQALVLDLTPMALLLSHRKSAHRIPFGRLQRSSRSSGGLDLPKPNPDSIQRFMVVLPGIRYASRNYQSTTYIHSTALRTASCISMWRYSSTLPLEHRYNASSKSAVTSTEPEDYDTQSALCICSTRHEKGQVEMWSIIMAMVCIHFIPLRWITVSS